jgi:hypothetical protein
VGRARMRWLEVVENDLRELKEKINKKEERDEVTLKQVP